MMAKIKQRNLPSCLISSDGLYQTIQEGCQIFSFPKEWAIEKYDAWEFIKNDISGQPRGFNGIKKGIKSVDFCVIDAQECLWLIEVKDYRKSCRESENSIVNIIIDKFLYSLSGLFAARYKAKKETEKNFAQRAATTQKMRFVLHLETQKICRFDDYILDRADIQQKMEQKLSRIAPNPVVASMNNLQSLPWSVCDA